MREDWVFCNWETLSGKRGAELEEEVKLGTPDDLFKETYIVLGAQDNKQSRLFF
ncbi:MAG: hypothetical protein GXY77_05485 [Fibrobacter sp.]|nr:hypothetical protein [Fibrobacter sp.]